MSASFETAVPAAFLGEDEFIQCSEPAIRSLARELRQSATDDVSYAKAAFEWVRDQVRHSWDVADPRVTLTASEVLEHRVGLCYAKSHLLAALLRGEGIPTGLCYQRLVDGEGHVLHGLVAVHLRGAWHRQDARGNKDGVDAQFCIGAEKLAWPVDDSVGEVDYPQLFASPVRSVVDALRAATDVLELCDGGLPTGLDGPR
ncbi:transglutaminase-like domain-containing protein [[Mycobacterium] vasticus]|uniref:Transglutaminase family protein n=1 Tax=[Mycobacterium] vasticus TaxID=2875777 RepID=A0ABU5Z3N3_9MYCO|nr:transglutaminase family protein [Mycolicibacter sp. MYC017]MEB3071204.1 transglutaminase family protein [Mycolicibacter sp. MYC017]